MRRTFSLFALVGAVFSAAVFTQPLTAAQKKKQHPRYDEFRKARVIAVATLKSAKLVGVLESFPPIYQFQLQFSQVLPIKGPLRKGITFKARYSKSQVKQPQLPVGKKFLITLREAGKNSFFVTKMEPVDEAIVKVARKATADVRAELAKWRKNPKTHPRYDTFRNAKGLAIVRGGGPNTAIGFAPGRNELSFSLAAENVLRGALPPNGPIRATYSVPKPEQPRLPAGNSWIITYQMVNGRCVVATMDERTEVLNAVLKAAVKAKK